MSISWLDDTIVLKSLGGTDGRGKDGMLCVICVGAYVLHINCVGKPRNAARLN